MNFVVFNPPGPDDEDQDVERSGNDNDQKIQHT